MFSCIFVSNLPTRHSFENAIKVQLCRIIFWNKNHELIIDNHATPRYGVMELKTHFFRIDTNFRVYIYQCIKCDIRLTILWVENVYLAENSARIIKIAYRKCLRRMLNTNRLVICEKIH